MPARLLRYGDQSTAASAARKWDIRTMPIAHTERDEGPEPRAFTRRSPRVAIPDASPETRVPHPARAGSGARCASRLGVCEHTSIRAAAAWTYAGGAKMGAEILRRALE